MKMRGKAIIGVGLAIFMAALISGCGGASSSSGDSGDSGSSGGTNTTLLRNVPKDLGVGDALIADIGSSASATLDFADVLSSAKFILAVGSYNETGASTSLSLTGSLSLPSLDIGAKGMEIEPQALSESDGYTPDDILSAWLRASESTLADNETPISGSLSKALVAKAAAPGTTFRVLSSLSSVSIYTEVDADAKCETDHVVFYLDSTVSSNNLSDSDINTLCEEFETIYESEISILGATSDVDGDGKFHVLMTSQINRLGATGGGIITGYFYAGDLFVRSSSNVVSNYQEIIYTLVPDEDGEYGYAISKEFALSNLLPAVLPHELQHAISYNQHVFVHGGSAEDSWLNEAMSHLIEDVMGQGNENPSRYSLYLASPSSSGVVVGSSPNLSQRGASYLFLRFLYEQASSGTSFLTALEQTSDTGVANLENAFAGPSDFSTFKDFMPRWAIALAMTDRGISQDRNFTYIPRTRDSVTNKWHGVCLDCDADDNRGTTLTGVNLNTYSGSSSASLSGSTQKFYDISSVPDQIRVAGSSSGSNFAIMVRYQ